MSEEKQRKKVRTAIQAKQGRVLSKMPGTIVSKIHTWKKTQVKHRNLYFNQENVALDLAQVICVTNFDSKENEWIHKNQTLIKEYFDLEHMSNTLFYAAANSTLSCGIKTTWSYDFYSYLSETSLHRFFGLVYGEDSALKFVIPCVLMLPMFAISILGWPVVVACVGGVLLSIGLDLATRFVKNYPDREVIVINEAVFKAYEKAAFPEIQRKLAEDQSKLKQKKKTIAPTQTTETIHSSPVSQIPADPGYECLDPKDLKPGQENYVAVRVSSMISKRWLQVKDKITDKNNVKKAIRQLSIFNPSSTNEDQSFLQYSTKDKAGIDALDRLITQLFPDIQEICQTKQDKNDNWTLTISNEKAREIVNAEDFNPEIFLNSLNEKPSNTNI